MLLLLALAWKKFLQLIICCFYLVEIVMEENRSKKRVARFGRQHSNKKSQSYDEVTDVVQSIMKEMDANISSPGNEKLYNYIESSTSKKIGVEKKSSHSNETVQSKRVNVSHASKYLPAKRHPLMEKCQKNLKFIKHNRKIDKPRAHVGGLNDSPRKRLLKKNLRESCFKSENGKLKTQIPSRQEVALCRRSLSESSDDSSSVNVWQRYSKEIFSIPENAKGKTQNQSKPNGDFSASNSSSESDDESPSCREPSNEKLLNSSADSDSEFESFIRVQKKTCSSGPKANRRGQSKRKKLDKHKGKNVDEQKDKYQTKNTRTYKSPMNKRLICESDDEVGVSGLPISCEEEYITDGAQYKTRIQSKHEDGALSASNLSLASDERPSCMKPRNEDLSNKSADSDFESFIRVQKKTCSVGHKVNCRGQSKRKVLNKHKGENVDEQKDKCRAKSTRMYRSPMKKILICESDDEVASSGLPVSCVEYVCEPHEKSMLTNEREILTNETPVESNRDSALCKLKCAVRLERNLEVENAVSFLLPCTNGFNAPDAVVNGELPDLNNECAIVGELSKDRCSVASSENDQCGGEKNQCGVGKNCDIQISDVVSLRDNLNVCLSNDSHQNVYSACESNTQSFSDTDVSKLLREIDFDSLKGVIETLSQKSGLPSANTGDSTINKIAAVNDGFSLPLHVQEALSKIDRNQVLFLTNSSNKLECSENVSVPRSEPISIPCSSRTGDCISRSNVGVNKPVISHQISDSIWQNLSDAVNQIRSSIRVDTDADVLSTVSGSPRQLSVDRNNYTSTGYSGNTSVETPCENTISGIACATLKNESPSEELVNLAIDNIKDISMNSTVDNLVKLYNQKMLNYEQLKSTETDTGEGMKMILKSKAEDLNNLYVALNFFIKQDPCFYRTASEYKNREILNERTKVPENNGNAIIPVNRKVCNNCGKLAKIKCLTCSQVFFCDEECGLEYWKNGHYMQCQGKSL